jgi:uncharacterized protein (DUF2267 family)
MSMDQVERVGAVLGSPREGSAEDFFRAIRESGALPIGLDVEEAASAVLCTLLGRLDLGQARLVLDALPPGVTERIGWCPVHGGAAGEALSETEFLSRVAQRLQLGDELAEPVTAVVFRAARAQLPPHPEEVVARQLPRELQEIWRGGART